MTGFRLGPLFVSAAIIVLLLAATADKRVRPVGGTEVDGTIAAAAVTVAAMKNEPAAIEGDEVPGPAAAAPDAVTPKPAVVVDADTAVGEKLRELAGGKFDRVIGGKKSVPPSTLFIRVATTRRCGFPTAIPMPGQRPRSPISVALRLMVSNRQITRCLISARLLIRPR
jgi:hypothetical protein